MFKKYDSVALTRYTEGAYPLRDDLTKDDFQYIKSRQVRIWDFDSAWVYVQYTNPSFSDGWSAICRIRLSDVRRPVAEPPRVVSQSAFGLEKQSPTYEERNPKKESYPGWGGYYNN